MFIVIGCRCRGRFDAKSVSGVSGVSPAAVQNNSRSNQKKKLMNIESRQGVKRPITPGREMPNECILSILKKIERHAAQAPPQRQALARRVRCASDSILRHSAFDIRYSAVRCSVQVKSTKKKSSENFQLFLGDTPRVRSEPVL
jgi:hypothetical protein